MRIATNTTYTQQAITLDNLEAQYQNQGNTLSTGRSLNAPSDDPAQIGQDLSVRNTLAVENQTTLNLQGATEQLTSTDTALASLTSVLQSARELGVRGASDLITGTARQAIGGQVDQYLQQAISLANTEYNGLFLFAGSAQPTTAPVTTTGSPVSAISFSGNDQTATPALFNGQQYGVSPTLQQSFNYNATNGSPSVFDTLITLRDTLEKGVVTDESAQSLNHVGSVIYGAASPAGVRTTLGTTPSPFSIAPVPDSAGNYTIAINNVDAAGVSHTNTYTFGAATVLDDATATSITGAINAKNTGANPTGLTATFNAQTQRLVLTNAGGGAFSVTDQQSTGSTNTSNFTTAFQLAGTATLAQSVSTQLGDIDNVLNVTLSARQVVGSRINALAQINTQVSSDVLNNTSIKSGIEDTDIAKTSTEFSATQAALTASYSTTTRLESKDLFDYL